MDINEKIMKAKMKKKMKEGEPMPHPPGSEAMDDLGWIEKIKKQRRNNRAK